MASIHSVAPAGQVRRFSIRLPHWGWLLAVTVALIVGGIGLAIGGHVYRQRIARAAIQQVGGSIATERNCPEWLREWCDDDERISPFDDVVGAYMGSEQV